MNDLKGLTERMDAEFASFQQKTEAFQVAAKAEYEARESRFHNLFEPAAKRLAEMIKPRLQLLVDRFKDRVNVKPVVKEHTREAQFTFDSPLARIALTFSLSHDSDVKNLLFEQDLKILPILMQYEDRSTLTMPLDKIDDAAVTKWFDDRIVNFIQTMAAMHRNQYYLKDHLVTDPIAGVQLPKYAAKATLEEGGKTHYFISEETKREFASRVAAKK